MDVNAQLLNPDAGKADNNLQNDVSNHLTRTAQNSRFGVRDILLIAVIAISGGVCYPSIKQGLNFAPPFLFAGLRTLTGGFLLLGLLLVLNRNVWPDCRDWRWLVPFGLVATSMTFGSMFLSPTYTTVGIAAVAGNLQPLILIGLAAWVLGERVTIRKGLALGLGLGGVILLSAGSLAGSDAHAIHGVGLALLSSSAAAVASIWVRRMQLGKKLIMATGWQLVIGSVPLIGLSWVLEPEGRVIWSFQFAGLLLVLAFFGTALAALGWFWLLERHEAGRLGMCLFLVPVFGIVISTILYNDILRLEEICGIALILVGTATALLKMPGLSSMSCRRLTRTGVKKECQ